MSDNTLFPISELETTNVNTMFKKVQETVDRNRVRFDGREDVTNVIKFLNEIDSFLKVASENQLGSESVNFFLKDCTTRYRKRMHAIISTTSVAKQRNLRMQLNVINDLGKRF